MNEEDGNETSVEMEYYCSPSETSLSSLITAINNIAGLESNSGSTAAAGSVNQEQEDGVVAGKFQLSSTTTSTATTAAAATTSGKRVPAPLPPHDRCSCSSNRHKHLIVGRTTSTPISAPTTATITSSSASTTTLAAAASVVTVMQCASPHCLIRHSGNCVPAHHHQSCQMIDLPQFANNDYDEDDDYEDGGEGGGPASLLITPLGMNGMVLKSCLISSPSHPVLQQSSASSSSCSGPSSKAGGGAGNSFPCSCKLTVNKNCNNRSDTCRSLWSKGGSGAGAGGKKRRKSHVALIDSVTMLQQAAQPANQLIITSSPASSLTLTGTTMPTGATAGAAAGAGVAANAESGNTSGGGGQFPSSGVSLCRYASDESLPSDSGCGSSIGKASHNSLSTGSNRSSICTVEDQPSASSSTSSSSSSSSASTSSSLSAGSTTGSHSSSSASSSAGSHSIRRSIRSPYVGQAVALQDCTPCPYDKDALAFRKGDIVNIIAKNDTGTWIGTCNGKIGHFKFISVEEIGNGSSKSSSNKETCSNKNCSSSSRPLTVASNTSSSHVVDANATESRSSSPRPTLHKSRGTDSGTKSETMITAIRKAGGMRRRGESGGGGGGCGEREGEGEEQEERNSDSLRSSLSAAMTSVASIDDPNGDSNWEQKERKNREGEEENEDDHNDDKDQGGRNAGISGGERQFSRMRGFLIMKKQQQQQYTLHSDAPSCARLRDGPSNLLTFISVGQFLDLLSPDISSLVGNEILPFLEANGFTNLKTLTSQAASGLRGRQELRQLLLSFSSNVKKSDADLLLQSLNDVIDWVRREEEGEKEGDGAAGTTITGTSDPKVGSQIIKRPGGKTCVTITSSSSSSHSSTATAASSSSSCTSGRREVRDESEIESHSSCPPVSSSSQSLSLQQRQQRQLQQQKQQQQGLQINGSQSSAAVVRKEHQLSQKGQEIPASRDQSPVTMNHVQHPPIQRQQSSSTSVQKAAVNRLFLNLKEGFSLSSTKNKNNNNNSKNNKANINNNSSSCNGRRAGSEGKGLMILKSAPSTPVTASAAADVREPAPSTPSDDLTNWFTRKLNFFTSSSHTAKGSGSGGGTDGISSGNKSVRNVSRDDLLDDCRRSQNDAAAAPPPTHRRLSNSVSMGSFHPTSTATSGNVSSSASPTTSKYSKLRAKSKSFFRKEPRANSADTRCNLSKRHSSHEPLYGNAGSITGCVSNSGDPDYGIQDQSSSSGHRELYRSQSKFLDSDYLMEGITHTYKPNPQRKTSLSSSKMTMSSKFSSRSVFDLRNSKGSHAGGENISYHAKTGAEAAGSGGEVTTLEGKKRMVPLRKLLSCDSSAKMRSQSICVPRSLALDSCSRSGSSSNFRFPADPATAGGSLHHLASIPTTPATTSASCKPISKMLLDSLNQRLREESIDLTTDPYSDVGGFCGIPAALVQRYAEESAHDVYDVADALDHLRLESLLMQGRRGIPNDFLGDWCSGVTLAETMCLQDLHKWLISIGLSMYESLLLRNGWSHMDLIGNMKEADMEMMGIRRKSHMRIFINAIEAMKMNH